MKSRRGGGVDVAIVGMACRFPGSADLAGYWANILAGADATSEVPPDRWDPAVFFDPASRANDRVACKRGGYLDAPIRFDPASHGIMPNTVDGGEPEPFLVLDAARSALADAGWAEGVIEGRRVEVVIGRGNYFNRGNLTRLQHGRIVAQTLAILGSIHPDWSPDDLEAIRRDLKSKLPPFEAATIPGQLTNATAGLVANRLGLTGASYVVDAASASSLVALDLGARALAEGRADLAIVGGVYLEADVDFPMVFRQLRAQSRSGRSMPFSQDADGLLSGEGVGVVVLKRRSDAERDGDRSYAILRGVGIASDGREVGLASPSAKGHARAIRRAYRMAKVDPASVGLVEGHGLGVPAADRAELRALRATFPPVARGRRALGAVSSMIGHAMPAAGIAGLIKTALALHHRVLPPTLHADRPHPLLSGEDSPFTLIPIARPWVHGDPSTPRRAGVNAFGFAGINAHAVLEEHPPSADGPGAMLDWDTEAVLLAAPDRAGLIDRSRALLDWLRNGPEAPLKDVAASIREDGPVRLGLVAKSPGDLADRLESAAAMLADPVRRSIRDARGAYFWERLDSDEPVGLAFLFPGEGSQYPGMLADLCPHFPEVRAQFDTADRLARASGAATWPSEALFGPEAGAVPALWSAGLAVNVVLSAQWGLYQLLTRLGLRPDAVAGHSSGELLALAASGALRVDRAFEDDLGQLGAIFGDLETSGRLPAARLVAVAADRAKVEEAIRGMTGLAVAMDNCPHQVVIAGTPGGVEAAVARLRARGVACEDLPFSRAYHTEGFAPAMGPIEAFFGGLIPGKPRVPIYSCASAARMPDEPESIRRLAVAQWTRPVEFRRTVEAMHADGLRTFVDVGARGNLAGFVEDTLRGRPMFAVAANLPRRSDTSQLNHLVASLFARGVSIDPAHLYARRRPKLIDFNAPIRRSLPTPSLAVGFPTMALSQSLIDRLKPPSDATHRPAEIHANGTGSMATSDGWTSRDAPIGHRSVDGPMLEFQRTLDSFLATQRAVMGAYLGDREPESGPTPIGPWAGELVSIVPGCEAVSVLQIAIPGDPIAEHHTLGGRRVSAIHRDWRGLPVLPFAVMAEMLAEAGSRLAPGLVLTGLRDVRAHKWIRYEDEPFSIELRATVEADRPGSVRVAIHNRGPAVFEGVADFGPVRPEPIDAGPFHLDHPRPCRFDAASIYAEQWLFHGPALQAVVGIGPISADGIEGTLRVVPLGPLLREGASADGLMSDPILLDNFTHLLGAWGLDQLADDGDVIFPLGMEELAIHGDRPTEGSDVACRVAIRGLEGHRVRVDADLVRPDGTLWMAIRGWEDWRFRWPGRYRDALRMPDRVLLGEPLDLPGLDGKARAVWLEPPGDMGRAVWRDVLEHVQLGPEERSGYLALPGPDLRRTHRLWGRIAAKEAARRLWLDRGGAPIYPADLIVGPDPMGKPILRTRAEVVRDLPSISIAHVDGVAVAMASDASGWVGIDVEPIRDRSEGFEAMAFTPIERALLADRGGSGRSEWVARLWCAKEAAAKATGLGFAEGPSGAEVVAIGPDGSATVGFRGVLASALPGPIRVMTSRRGDHAWAWTLGERTES